MPGSKCSANFSSLARSSAQVRSPYTSNIRAVGGGHTVGVAQDALFPQLSGSPPTFTVAVKGWPSNPVLSTVIDVVPCPAMIFPADTVQLKVSFADGSPPDTFAAKVSEEPMLESGQVTTTTGQLR